MYWRIGLNYHNILQFSVCTEISWISQLCKINALFSYFIFLSYFYVQLALLNSIQNIYFHGENKTNFMFGWKQKQNSSRTIAKKYDYVSHNMSLFMYYYSCFSYVLAITITYQYNFDPLKPHFFIVKLGFTGVYIIFLISVQKHRLWVLVRTASPRRF